MTGHNVVSQKEWLDARLALLAKEKAFTRQQDELVRERQQLPWVRVEKTYTFETPDGKKTLAELFGDKSQLLIYHFMFGPEQQEGCPSCSMAADTLNGNYSHLHGRDIELVMVSRGPLNKFTPFKGRMGWTLPWVSSYGTTFNRDFGVTFTPEELQNGTDYNFGTSRPYGGQEMHGLSAFYKGDDGTVYHSYSSYGRGAEPLLAVYPLLDMAPKGRDEEDLPYPMAWVRHHDRYEAAKPAAMCCAH